jgi:hypothetical protein
MVKMGKFKTVCGKEFDSAQNNTHASGVYVARKYPEDKKDRSFDLAEECQKCSAIKREFIGHHCSMEDMNDSYFVTNTICIANNVDNKTYGIVENYNEPCGNTTESYLFEITLQEESLIGYLYYSIPRSKGASAYDYMNDIVERLWEDKFEDQLSGDDDNDEYVTVQLFDMERGEPVDIELYNMRDLEKLVTGIRLVEFSQEIDK